jgi:hypothetical protein
VATAGVEEFIGMVPYQRLKTVRVADDGRPVTADR